MTMKRLFLLLCVISLTACDTSDIPGDVITQEFERIRFVMPRASWQIDKFVTENGNQTADFDSIVFKFKEPDSLVVEFQELTANGKWYYQSFPGESEKLVLEAPEKVAELTDAWKILSLVNAEVHLSRKGTDTLIFKRRDSI